MSNTELKSNFDPVMNRLQALASLDPVQKRRITYAMGLVAQEQVKDRVKRGVSTNGQKFQDYSKKPSYFAKKRGVSKKLGTPWGKEYGGKRRKRFASGERKGKLHRSRYLPKGYFEFRQVTGRNTDSNRLIFTGAMMNNLKVDAYGKDGAVLHFPRKQENSKAMGNQEKYKFFLHNSRDRDEQAKEGQLEMEYIMKQEGFKKT